MEQTTMNIPVLALRGLTVFPGQNAGFDVEREISMLALNNAMEEGKEILLVTQRELAVTYPDEEDLYTLGTIGRVLQIIKTSDSSVRVLVHGQDKGRIRRLWQTRPFLQANVVKVEDDFPGKMTRRIEAIMRQTYAIFGEYREMVPDLPDEVIAKVLDCQDPGELANYIGYSVNLRPQDRQRILEELNPVKRLKLVNEILTHELDVISLVLQHELGEDGDDEIQEYSEKVQKLNVSEEIREKLMKEVSRLAKQPYGSAEASVIRNYLDTCLEMPWGKETKERADVEKARAMLDKDHYGLTKVKERILEYIAVRQIHPQAKGKIICLVGPPGVGKTSIAISVAKAMNRKLYRISLGGVRDEADIRGHRKTYIGAMPGRIIDGLIHSGSMNPLLVLDEIDKLASDMRGDPASALLEVLDSEQNSSFRDHFLEIPVDLSRVMFITTANTTDTIPRPLLDRMEVIELGSYTDEEKVEIARQHLIPKQLKEHGLQKRQLSISEDALRSIISGYTRESGVRILERKIAAICRKAAMKIATEGVKKIAVTPADIKEFLGVVQYTDSEHMRQNEVGVVNGLAWTQVGGEILEVEVNVMDGTGKLELTGNLGTVMQESAKTALSCLRSRAGEFGIEKDFYKTEDIHIHFPEGAVPKDGPSAGIAITTAMLSALTGKKVRKDVAMTGEVTLRGRVLPIGGLKEKTMAALRNGIETVIIPRENEKDLEEIDQTVRRKLRFVPVSRVEEVFSEALVSEGKKTAAQPEEMPLLAVQSCTARPDLRV